METIYLADDERHIRELMQAFLSQADYDVHTFEDGDALMTACRQQMPDLVILDIMMPGTDGLSVCTQLRQQNETLPIIIVSAKDSPYDRVTGLTLGGDDYLIKPFLPLELVARVKALLRRAHPAVKAEEPAELTFGPLVISMARWRWRRNSREKTVAFRADSDSDAADASASAADCLPDFSSGSRAICLFRGGAGFAGASGKRIAANGAEI